MICKQRTSTFWSMTLITIQFWLEVTVWGMRYCTWHLWAGSSVSISICFILAAFRPAFKDTIVISVLFQLHCPPVVRCMLVPQHTTWIPEKNLTGAAGCLDISVRRRYGAFADGRAWKVFALQARWGWMFVHWCWCEHDAFRNVQDRMVHTEKEAREMAEPEDQVCSGDGVIWRDQLVVFFPLQDFYGMGGRTARWSLNLIIGRWTQFERWHVNAFVRSFLWVSRIDMILISYWVYSGCLFCGAALNARGTFDGACHIAIQQSLWIILTQGVWPLVALVTLIQFLIQRVAYGFLIVWVQAFRGLCAEFWILLPPVSEPAQWDLHPGSFWDTERRFGRRILGWVNVATAAARPAFARDFS